MDSFHMYLSRLFRDSADIMKEWNIDKIEHDLQDWKISYSWLKLYILTNDCESAATHTMVGCVDNLSRRIDQQNGRTPGGRPEAKRADGKWTLVCFVLIPPYRNFSTKNIKNDTENGRGWISRSSRAITSAIQMGLQFRILVDTVDIESKFYAKRLADLIANYVHENDVDNLKEIFFGKDITDEKLRRIEGHLKEIILNPEEAAKKYIDLQKEEGMVKRKRSKDKQGSNGDPGVPVVKRKRGRPRKYPLPTETSCISNRNKCSETQIQIDAGAPEKSGCPSEIPDSFSESGGTSVQNKISVGYAFL
jgi:hypothetical protein